MDTNKTKNTNTKKTRKLTNKDPGVNPGPREIINLPITVPAFL